MSEPKKLSCGLAAPAARLPLIDGRFQMTKAATRKVSALRNSARSTSSRPGASRIRSLPMVVSTAKTTAASTGVSPKVVTRDNWLAGSSWSLRSMLGTAASLAGIQNRLIASMRNWATNSQIRLSTSGIEANSTNRMMSVTTIVLRRSNRSANAPARGPRTIAGSRRNSSTPPSAKFAAAKPSTSDVAVAVMASSPSQSPKLDSDIDSHSLRKSFTRSTARSFATRPTPPMPSPGTAASGVVALSSAGAPTAVPACAVSCSVSGAAASPGTGVPAGGRPSAGTVVRSTGRASAASSGGSAGGVGSDGMGAPRVGGPERSWPRRAHGTGRG